MRLLAAFQLLVAVAIVVVSAAGALPWWPAAFPLLTFWLCGAQVVERVVQWRRRARARPRPARRV